MGARNTPFLPQRNPEEAALHSGTERSLDDDEGAQLDTQRSWNLFIA